MATSTVQFLVSEAIRPDTRKKYYKAWEKYVEFCAGQDLLIAPITTLPFLRFIAHEYEKGSAPSSVELYLTGIRHVAHKQGVEVLLDEQQVRAAMLGFKKVSANPSGQDSISMSLLKSFGKMILVDNTLQLDAEFDRHMVWTSLVFAFFGLMRVSEYTDVLIRDHVTEDLRSIRIKLIRSKNAPLSHSFVHLAENGDSMLCPLRAFKCYSSMRDKIFPSDFAFFVFVNGDTYSPHNVNLFIAKLAKVAGYGDSWRLSSHSLRIGGATEAARAGVNVKVIQEMGRWRSDCFLKYIRPLDRDILEAQKDMIKSFRG